MRNIILCIIMLLIGVLYGPTSLAAGTYIKGPGLIEGLTSTATASGTTTLTKDSETFQQFTGTLNQTVILPNATTLPVGRYFVIANRSSGTLTIQKSGALALTQIIAGAQKKFLVTDISSAAGIWDISLSKVNLADTTDITGTLPIANGGTNSTTSLNNGRIMVSTGGAIVEQAALTASKPVRSDASGYLTTGNLNLGSEITGTLPVANGGTGASSFNGPSGNLYPIVFYDGTKLATDSPATHLAYDALNDVVYSSALTISGATTQIAKFTNTAAQSALGGAGMSGYSDSGAAMVSGNRLGYYTLGGALDSSHNMSNSSAITSFATENWSGTAAGSKLVFETTANTTLTRSAALTLDQDKSATFTGTVNVADFVATGTTGAVKLHSLTTTQRDALTPSAGMIIYNTTTTQFECYRTSWASCGGARNVSSNLTLAASGTISISLINSDESFLVQGNSGPITMSTNPFGVSQPVNGYRITLIGNSDTNTVTIPTNDAADGVIGYSVTLGKGQTATYEYNVTLDRYVIISTSN